MKDKENGRSRRKYEIKNVSHTQVMKKRKRKNTEVFISRPQTPLEKNNNNIITHIRANCGKKMKMRGINTTGKSLIL